MTTPDLRAQQVADDIMQAIMDRIMVNGEPIMSVDILNPAPALIAKAIKDAEDALMFIVRKNTDFATAEAIDDARHGR